MNQLLLQLQRFAQEQPERPVLVDEHRAMGAAQLLSAVESQVARLAATGASRIGLLADSGIDWVIVDLASQFAGLCLVPVPTFFSDQQIEHVLGSAAVDLLTPAVDGGNWFTFPSDGRGFGLPPAGCSRLRPGTRGVA